MQATTSSTCAILLADFEAVWQGIDELLGSLGPADWARKHGKDWTYADVPYHLAYYDREMTVVPIERGLDVPADERHAMRTMAELNAWNAQKFAERPANQTPEQSLQQMHATREALRRCLARLGEADLDRPAWVKLPLMGWVSVREVLGACYMHTWKHFLELRLRLRRDTPMLSAGQTHRGLECFMNFFPKFLDPQQIQPLKLTAVMDFSGPSGGAWTFQIADGACQVCKGHAEHADLVMTQTPETFIKSASGMLNPMWGLLTGQMKVRGFRAMPTFGKVFREPALDQPLGHNSDPTKVAG